MGTSQIAFIFNLERIAQNIALVFRGITRGSNRSGNRDPQTESSRCLTFAKITFQKNIQEVFSRTVEVDETYIGGQS